MGQIGHIFLLFFPHIMMMHGGGSKKCMGLIMVIFGILFLLGTMGVWPDYTFAKYWPAVVIVIGLHKLLCPCHNCGMEKKGDCCGGGKCEGGECDKSMKKR